MKYTKATHAGPQALSAELDSIRTEGVAYDREEHETGIISIAAPILTKTGFVIGAVSVATTTTRHDLAGLETFRPMLLETAHQIGAEAQNWQSPT